MFRMRHLYIAPMCKVDKGGNKIAGGLCGVVRTMWGLWNVVLRVHHRVHPKKDIYTVICNWQPQDALAMGIRGGRNMWKLKRKGKMKKRTWEIALERVGKSNWRKSLVSIGYGSLGALSDSSVSSNPSLARCTSMFSILEGINDEWNPAMGEGWNDHEWEKLDWIQL